MIKDSTYIRKFTAKQKKQLEEVAAAQKLKTVPDILFFALENYIELSKDVARLNRIIEMKHKKQLTQQELIDELQSKLDKIQEFINS